MLKIGQTVVFHIYLMFRYPKIQDLDYIIHLQFSYFYNLSLFKSQRKWPK